MIGNKNYSSWSLRPWLLLKTAGIAFSELRIPLDTRTWRREIGRHSPSRKVPVLKHGEITVWESLAICEYVAETFPECHGWPSAPDARAAARSVSAEMHSGFSALRDRLPLNCRRRVSGFCVPEDAARDVERVAQIWRWCREHFGAGGPWLFGRFSIADAMYAPVALRFKTYGVVLDEPAEQYTRTVCELAAVRQWLAAAAVEPEVIHAAEVIA